MTKTEFYAWKDHTAHREHLWTLDLVHNGGKNRDYLFVRGNVNGQYIIVQNDGLVSIGNYEGAIPHIGEASFRALYHKKFKTPKEAFRKLVNAAGMDFLKEFAG